MYKVLLLNFLLLDQRNEYKHQYAIWNRFENIDLTILLYTKVVYTRSTKGSIPIGLIYQQEQESAANILYHSKAVMTMAMAILERTGLSRHLWHLPLFFVALLVLFSSLIGALFFP